MGQFREICIIQLDATPEIVPSRHASVITLFRFGIYWFLALCNHVELCLEESETFLSIYVHEAFLYSDLV